MTQADQGGPAEGDASTDQRRRLEIRCPHCHTPVEMVADTPFTEITCSSCGSRFSLAGDETETRRAASIATIGRFELVERLGVGGFGTVWKARDTELDRTVTLKVPRAGQLDRLETEQFLREARAAAQLKHPNIVSVHEVGRDGETPYIVSDLVRGVSLADWLTGQRLTAAEAAKLCVTIAEALHHAHQAGVVHRDLKPANVMIDADGQPHIMDFGLAKRDAGEITLTTDGQVLGTPAYMSPEQAEGKAHQVDGRSDVYSLGVILFELLTGERPFRGNARMLIHQVINDDPPAPRRLNGTIPRDLETICLKCLEKARDRRYATAQELADDLGRWRAGEPIHARPVGRTERLWRWSRRNPALATMAAVVFVVAISGFTGILWQWGRAEGSATLARTREGEVRVALGNAQKAQRRAEEGELTARRYLYAAQMNLAMRAWEDGNLPPVRRLLAQHWPQSGKPDLRSFEWYYLWRLSHPENVRLLRAHEGEVSCLALTPDGKTLASAGEDQTIRLWDVDSGGLKASFGAAHQGAITDVAFSPDARTLASASTDRTVKLWDTSAGKLEATLSGHRAGLSCVAFSHNGRLLASGTGGIMDPGDQMVKLWDIATGKERSTLKCLHAVFAVAFSPDDRMLATGGGHYFGESEFKVWDLAAGEEILALKGHQGSVYDILFTPDAATIISCASDTTIRVWDAKTGQQKQVLAGHAHEVHDLALSPGDGILASAGRDLSVRLWDLARYEHLATLGHDDGVTSVAFAPDGKVLASASSDGVVRLWDLSVKPGPAVLRHEQEVRSLAYSPDGNLIASGDFDGTVNLWDSTTGGKLATLRGGPGAVNSVCVSPDGKTVASGTSPPDGSIRLWDLSTRRVKHQFKKEGFPASFCAFSPDGRLLAIGSGDWPIPEPGVVDLYETDSGRKVATLAGHTRSIESVAFSPDGTKLVTGSYDGLAKVWDVATGSELYTLRGHASWVTSATFSPDGKRLATTSTDTTAKLWDAATGQELITLAGHRGGRVTAGAFSPDSMTLATAGWDGTVKLWDVVTGQERATIKAHARSLWAVAFSPDGRTLATASRDGTVKLWRAATEQAVRRGKEEDSLQIRVRSKTLSAPRDDALLRLGKHKEAIAAYEQALKLRPKDTGVLNNLAWVLATSPVDKLRNGKRAIELATEAAKLTEHKQPYILSTLGAAYAETGGFATAIKWLEKALEMAKNDAEREALRKELESYRAGKPWRQLPSEQ